MVCRYAPPGNWVGKFQENVQPRVKRDGDEEEEGERKGDGEGGMGEEVSAGREKVEPGVVAAALIAAGVAGVVL